MKPEILVGAPEELAAAFVKRLEREAAEAIARRGRFALALTGGSSATALLPRFVSARVDWLRTDLFWSDERAVAISDSASNYGLARRLWLDLAGVPAANVHRLRGEMADLGAAADAAEREMEECLGERARLDVLWLGVGEDGHVASLFPGHALLAERRRFVAALTDSPKPPAGRLTLTLATIAAARQVVFMALGAAKAAAVGAALGGSNASLPLALALGAARQSWFLLDPGAASELPLELSGR